MHDRDDEGVMAGTTAGEMAMTNGAAVMVAGQVLFRCQIQVRRKAEVEGRIMVAPTRSPTGEAVGRQMGTPSPGLREIFRRDGRMLRPRNNRLNPSPSLKGHKRYGSACLKAVSSVRINRFFGYMTKNAKTIGRNADVAQKMSLTLNYKVDLYDFTQ